jgi:hypothetical protein
VRAVRRQVTHRGAEGEGHRYGQPVEQFATGGGNAADRQRVFESPSGIKDNVQCGGESNCRHEIGNAECDVHDVSTHRAKDTYHHHRRPVGHRLVRKHAQLEIHDRSKYNAPANCEEFR